MQAAPSGGEAFDVVVVGGGPGGAAAATFLALDGARVLLLERERFPRYQLGESLMVSTIQGLCNVLGVSDAVENAGFIRKPGGVFRWGEGADLWNLSFTQARQLKSKDVNYAFHVERSKFDQILLDNARAKGVVVREGATVDGAIIEAGRVSGVRYRTAAGAFESVRSSFVVDASGTASRLFPLVGRRVFSQFFRNVALICYFSGADRLPPPLEGGGISEAFADGWMWFLPLSDRLTSVGAVIGAEQGALLQRDRTAVMARFIDACPHIRRLLATADLVTEGPYGQFRVRTDFSYTNQKFWMPGLVLVGDAACFLDPLFTTGVHLATYAGLLAARSINSVRRGQLDEASAFAEFECRYRLEFELFYNFLIAYYDMHDEGDRGFWHSRKVVRSPEIQNREFVDLLTGGADTPEEYFAAKVGIGKAAQDFVHQVKRAGSPAENARISRRMAETIHHAFQPKSGPRPFHLGFEDIRLMSWGREDVSPQVVSERNLIPSPTGLSWQRA
ncbi:MAG: FAD-dependent halogenase [Candidatus Eremiobacteraeota bacterium]|jgi:halogenation protein CepH|nr:FAD-dependent halogenase [Candidatus Eremiobacteraeota bacterium]